MKSVIYQLPENANTNELRKLISFASEEIQKFEIQNNELKIYLKDDCIETNVTKKIKESFDKYLKFNNGLEEKIFFENNSQISRYTSKSELEKDNLVKHYGDGLVGLKNEAIYLYEYFDEQFLNIAKELGAIEKKYPTLLPLDAFKKTSYLKTSPQYSMFCSCALEDMNNLSAFNNLVKNSEIKNGIEEPQHVLSPSACFHSYLEYENSILEKNHIITFNQNVFRNEGRFNWDDFGRFKDYNVREIVFFGDNDYVKNLRNLILEKVKEFLIKLNLNSIICTSYDPFVIPNMQLYKKIQLAEEMKYEIKMKYDNENFLAVASFNLHGNAFTQPFNILINEIQEPVTSCVGFGIERWVFAFLAQFGSKKEEWPEHVINYIKKRGE